MQMAKAKRHKVIRRLLWVIAVLVVVFAALPVWFPWALRPVLNHYGIHFTEYERTSYFRFKAYDVTAQWGNTHLAIKQFECVLPTTWVWRKLSSGERGATFAVREGELFVGLTENATSSRNGGVNETLDEIVQVAETLKRFSPVAELTNCRVLVDTNLVLLPTVLWRAQKLDAIVKLPQQPGEVSVVGNFENSKSPRLSLTWNAHHLESQFNFTNAATVWALSGKALWFTNQATFTAEFAPVGWWPSRGQVESAQLRIPADALRLRGYEELTANVVLTLVSNRFDVKTSGSVQPNAAFAADGFPEAKFEIAADGDTESVSVREFSIEAPWLRTELANAIGFTWRGELMAKPAEFRILADLSKLPGATMEGYVQGEGRVSPWVGKTPTLQFQLAATNVSVGEVEAEGIRMVGAFAFPQLSITEFSANLADNSKLSGRGALDVQRRELLQTNWKFSGGFLNRFLSGAIYSDLVGSGEVAGPLTNLTHNSEFAVTGLQIDKLKSIDAQARVSGKQLQLNAITGSLSARETMLAISGAADLSGFREQTVAATLTNVSLTCGKAANLTLQNPCELSFRIRTNAPGEKWTLVVGSFGLASAEQGISGSADLSWPGRGEVKLGVTNIAFSSFSDFWANDFTNIAVKTFAADVGWSNGPVTGSVMAVATLTNESGQNFALQAAVAAHEVLSISQLRVETGYVPTLSVTGSVPVRILPGRPDGWLVWDADQRISLTGHWDDSELRDFSVPLGKESRFSINQPELEFRIEGRPEAPEGSLRLAAHRIEWQSASNKLSIPPMENFQLRTELHPDGIELRTLTGRLDGQKVEARGVFPLSEADWKAFWEEKKLPDWSRAEGQLDLDQAQLEAFAKYLPRILAPEGQVTARLELKPGKQVGGLLLLTNASTYPLGSIAPLREISAVLQFDGQRATLERFRGRIGGQPISANGFVAIPNGRLKDYEVKLHGTNIPVARSPEFLLRGSFDVSLRGESNAPPLLAGKVTLHNGLFVQHASSRVWSRPRRPSVRPPYFSVTNEPLANWRMDLALLGDRFLRVRTPVFYGLLSANMQLKGTLSQPVLTGDLRADSGQIVFPFGGLEITQGYASFSGSDPQGPTLQINASGRNYRYEVGLEVKGPAETAAVSFSSTPPLTSEQILLMLTAGELPQTEFSFSTTSRAGQVVTFLGMDFYNQVFGSNRGEDRLIIRSGEDISEEGKVTYSVEYRFTDRWSIVGEYDQYNAFNGGLKWRIYSR